MGSLTVGETLNSLWINRLQSREMSHSEQTVLAHPNGARRIAVLGTEAGRAQMSMLDEARRTHSPGLPGDN